MYWTLLKQPSASLPKQESFVLICDLKDGRAIQIGYIRSMVPVSIHMTNQMESLNAAMSVNIALHQLTLP